MIHKSISKGIVCGAMILALSGAAAIGATGSLIVDFDPGGPQGDGRGVAFNGTHLYYTVATDTNIYEMSAVGGPGSAIRTILVPGGDPRAANGNGPLAWDGSKIWVADVVTGQKLFQVDPVSGATIAQCDLAAFNPGHPALAGLGSPAGLEYHNGELILSGDISRPGLGTRSSTVFVNPTTCAIRMWFQTPIGQGAPGYGTSGVSTDHNFLWQTTPMPFGTTALFFQSDLNGSPITSRPSFVAPSQIRDLAYDKVTFAPTCAVWAIEGSFYVPGGPPPKVKKHHVLAFEVPCNQPPTCAAGGPYVAECSAGTGTVNVDGSNSADPEGLGMIFSWSSADCPSGNFSGGTATQTLSMSGFAVPVSCSADLSVTDTAGDSAACLANVQVVDTIPPVLNVPKQRSVKCQSQAGVPMSDPKIQQWLAGVSATDTCAGVQVDNDMQAYIPISCAPQTSTPVNFTATDDAGNITTGASAIQVFDRDEPVIRRVRALTLECPFDNPGGALSDSRVIEWLKQTEARDFCTNGIIPVTASLIGNKGAVCQPGKSVTVQLKALDYCGNVETQKAYVTMLKRKQP